MSARARGRRRRHAAAHDNEERWLLTYADMITLLMALFMVLFSISSVNTSKFKSLQLSLKDAFSGKVMPGGRSIANSGSDTARSPVSQADAGDPADQAHRGPDHQARPDAEGQQGVPADQARDRRLRAPHGFAKQLETTHRRSAGW